MKQSVAKKDLDQLIKDRHSIRLFLPTPVPRPLVLEALALAQHAPSNSNIQPWRTTFVAGAALDRLKDALLAVAKAGVPNIPPLPATFRHYRSDLGMQLYGVSMGIAHDDKEGRAAAVLRNFDFFGAPLAAIISIPQVLGSPDVLSVGLWLQTLLLALTERGLGTCVEVSVAGYPEILRKELGIAPDLLILCGLAIGYADDASSANLLHLGRDPIENNVVFLEE